MKKLFITLFLLISIIANSATYYIDPAGTDGGGHTGGIADPWRTLSYAISVVASGNTIHINAGDYTEAGRLDLPTGVSIEGVGDASHVTATYYNVTVNYGAISLRSVSEGTNGNQTISNIKLDGNITGWCGISVYKRSNVKIINCTVVNYLGNGIAYVGGSVMASNDVPGTPPTTYETGNEIDNCYITDCASNSTNRGLIWMDSQDGALVHDNTLINDGYSDNFYAWGGHIRGVKFYNNISYKPESESTGFNFHMETGSLRGGVEVYNNEFYGAAVGMDIGAYDNTKGAYSYTASIHDNIFKAANPVAWVNNYYKLSAALTLEATSEDILFYNNHVENLAYGVSGLVAYAGRNQHNVHIYYNEFKNIGYTNNPWSYIIYFYGASATSTIYDVFIDNNVLVGDGAGAGIFLNTAGSLHDIYIRNNIVKDIVAYGWLEFYSGAGTISNIYVYNNDRYNNVGSNAIYYASGKTVTNLVQANNIITNPLLISTSDYRLQNTSPCINTGLDVELATDYLGYTVDASPDIGAHEYGADNPVVDPVVVITTSVFAGTTNATSGGNVTSAGGGTVTARGVCWGLTANPTTTNSHTSDGSGVGTYTSLMTGLSPSTTYHVRAYAVNEAGTGYGTDLSFTTTSNVGLKGDVVFINKKIFVDQFTKVIFK